MKKISESVIHLLNDRVAKYNHPSFIASDPISIPHRFADPEDIAIAGFLTAIISWGQRPVILKNADRLMEMMDNSPHDFLINASTKEFQVFRNFVHRTFSGNDCIYFVKRLSELYRKGITLEKLFSIEPEDESMGPAITRARNLFLSGRNGLLHRNHFADPASGSAAKRINMFLRWMIRKDNAGVDFGTWKKHNPALLICPLDLHSGNTARKLGLITRNANDWKAALELTLNLRKLDPEDPVKYDFALFGLGVFEGFW